MTPNSPPPPVQLLSMMIGPWIGQAIFVAAKLGIADQLKDGPKPVALLAERSGVDESSLYRILRALASVGVFTESEKGVFDLTPMASYLRSDLPGSLRGFSLTQGAEWHWRSWGDVLYSVKSGRPALPQIFQVEHFFQYLEQNPEHAADFNAAMVGFSSQTHLAAVKAYDFSGSQLVVDVGGGHGKLLASILARYPHLRGIVFDQPSVIAGIGPELEAAGVADRCDKIGGDFFKSVPGGGDTYILSVVIHDWKDEDAITILKNVRRVIPESGRLLLIEAVIPPGDTPHFGKFLDLQMLVVAGGKERTEDEYRSLFTESGFRLVNIHPTESLTSVIEAVPA